MAKLVLVISLCVVILFVMTTGSLGFRSSWDKYCGLEALDPSLRIPAEAGYVDRWDFSEKSQLRCLGLMVTRHTIEPNGLTLPSYSNAPILIYVLQGKGVEGVVSPGCPGTVQSAKDQYQKIHVIREGDVIAIPAGATNWAYNDGDEPLVFLAFVHVTSHQNQLDFSARRFFLSGRRHHQFNNIFNGFDPEILAESFHVEEGLVRAIQNGPDERGLIVRAKGGLQTMSPQENGVEETVCGLDIKRNIRDPELADVYNPRGGRVTALNGLDFPMLSRLRLSFEEGVLHRDSILAPHFHASAHSVIYAKRGRARVQVVDNNGKAVFDGEMRQGQILTVPQNYAAVMKTEREGFEWMGIKTNDKAQISTLAGKTSVMRALPVAVISNSFQVSREDAWRLKNARKETTIFSVNQPPIQIGIET